MLVFDKVVCPRQDILEQKSTVTAHNRCSKTRRDKRTLLQGWSILATGQRLSFIIIVLQTLSYQSRPIYSEPPYTIGAIVYLPSISISLLSIFFFGKWDRSNNHFTHKKCQTVQAHMHFMKKITGNSIAEPSTISLFSIDQPTPQVIQTRSYTFTNYLLSEKTVKRLESSM